MFYLVLRLGITNCFAWQTHTGDAVIPPRLSPQFPVRSEYGHFADRHGYANRDLRSPGTSFALR